VWELRCLFGVSGGSGAMPLLRISDVPVDGVRRRVSVTWEDGVDRLVAASSFGYQLGAQDAEKIRWYLEDFPEFRGDPAPALAAEVESLLARVGIELFRLVFGGNDAARIWTLARSRLGQVRVEIDGDSAEVPGLPWELLREAEQHTSIALNAGAFVRSRVQLARRGSPSPAAGDELRVLLVICRPGLGDDVPFRSVASQLVRSEMGRVGGLDLDVLRPPTFAKLGEVLGQAAEVGRPYHIVHFDGHGSYLDLIDLELDDSTADDQQDRPSGSGVARSGRSLPDDGPVAGPIRPGQHGYLHFENPTRRNNVQLVDGATLGQLLATTHVPVLVLNACRSAYSQAQQQPAGQVGQPATPQHVPPAEAMTAEAADGLPTDGHARIRAYGSLAAEVADAGVPGVVAMRYNVYVVTAAQFSSALYSYLLVGQSLGQAATAARRMLAKDPARQIGMAPIALQDWSVPLIYETAPLTLLTRKEPPSQPAPIASPRDSIPGDGPSLDLPKSPDSGFFGRDETLLALDRAFDSHSLVLLQGYAGAGKSSTAAEFARWYVATSGLGKSTDSTPASGALLWSSFEHHLPLSRLIDMAGDKFSEMHSNQIEWQAITSVEKRYQHVLKILATVPNLWVWDNVEPIAGFPSGAPSAWTNSEQDDLASFLYELVTATKCKVLIVSRRDERVWLTDLAARINLVKLPAMPIREGLQLAAAIAANHGDANPETDWIPLLRFSAGNPLTTTVLVGQALREHLITRSDMGAFVARLRAGAGALEPDENADLGRTQSLAASLSYGFTHAFTDAERDQLAVLHMFRDTVDAAALSAMGDASSTGDDAVPQLSGLSHGGAIALLQRAAEIGLLTAIGAGRFTIHPALPWYFASLFVAAYRHSGSHQTERVAHAYTHAIAQLGSYYWAQNESGRTELAFAALRTEEANFRHAVELARQNQNWNDAAKCVQGLKALYERMGRMGEWQRLVDDVTPYFTDKFTEGPLPGREDEWEYITHSRIVIAMDAGDWPTANRLQNAYAARIRDRTATFVTVPADQLSYTQKGQLRHLAVSEETAGNILRRQGDKNCISHYKEAIELYQRIGERSGAAHVALSLGHAYLNLANLRDLDQAERWYQRSRDLQARSDHLGRAKAISALGRVAFERFSDAYAARKAQPVLMKYWDTARLCYYEALDLLPPDELQQSAVYHNELGIIYTRAGQLDQALQHFQESIKTKEAQGNIRAAAVTRNNLAALLLLNGRANDARRYAQAALQVFESLVPPATQEAAKSRQIIALSEQDRPVNLR
jgi:tetratricopeptide (TPR) repeat protein